MRMPNTMASENADVITPPVMVPMYALVRLSTTPITRPPTMAPGMEPMPPSTAATKAFRPSMVNVALGTDGQGSGSNLDMFDAMRTACLIQGGIHENEERITAKDVIKMATINGAKALKLEDKIGSIEEGKQADLIIVDIEEKLDNIKMIPNLNYISNLVYNTSGNNVETTIVNGEILMENKEIKHIDVDNIIRNVNKMNN